LQQAHAGGEELKKVMKANVESEYAMCQKLAYEMSTKGPRGQSRGSFAIIAK
jgi:hypothetical protein